MRRRLQRFWRVVLHHGHATASVWIEDGYGRPLCDPLTVLGVRTEAEAIAGVVAMLTDPAHEQVQTIEVDGCARQE